ncbi:MAG: hypothetical protein SFY32_10875 [Bacteroidota bacterium]|nr:hypothetical protein [Bacteroidota bacterium]
MKKILILIAIGSHLFIAIQSCTKNDPSPTNAQNATTTTSGINTTAGTNNNSATNQNQTLNAQNTILGSGLGSLTIYTYLDCFDGKRTIKINNSVVGVLNNYFSKAPNCTQESGVIKLQLPAGKYELVAETEAGNFKWEKTIKLDSNDCYVQSLDCSGNSLATVSGGTYNNSNNTSTNGGSVTTYPGSVTTNPQDPCAFGNAGDCGFGITVWVSDPTVGGGYIDLYDSGNKVFTFKNYRITPPICGAWQDETVYTYYHGCNLGPANVSAIGKSGKKWKLYPASLVSSSGKLKYEVIEIKP